MREGIFKYFWVKISASIPVGMFVVNENQWNLIWVLIVIILIDTILGMATAVKYKRFKSWIARMGFVQKFLGYTGVLFTVFLLGVFNPLFDYLFVTVGAYFILCEAISNLEKAALLDIKVPPIKALSQYSSFLLGILNKDFKSIHEDNGEKAKSIERILEKK